MTAQIAERLNYQGEDVASLTKVSLVVLSLSRKISIRIR